MRKPPPTEQRIILPDVDWQKFEELLVELGEERTARMTYDRGKLELMTPLPEHDRCHKLIESLILVLVDELCLSVEAIAPILLTAIAQGRATEFDAGYYVHTPTPTSPKNRIEVPQVPPPDLAIEVAITKSALNKLAIYADLGVPEVWRYVTQAGDEVLKGNLLIYQLQDYQYVPCERSAVFPILPAQRVLEFIEQSDRLGLVQALKILRHWIQEIG